MEDYSQFGEYELFLRPNLGSATRHRIVVDIGAYGRENSNSYNLIAQDGFSGLLVEPDTVNINRVTEDFCQVRNRISLYRSCVSSKNEGVGTLYHYEDPSLSSCLPPNGTRFSTGSSTVPVISTGALLSLHRLPLNFDVLSIDTNGTEFDVLHGLLVGSSYRPGIIIFDYSYMSDDIRDGCIGQLQSLGYFSMGMTDRNWAWRRQR